MSYVPSGKTVTKYPVSVENMFSMYDPSIFLTTICLSAIGSPFGVDNFPSNLNPGLNVELRLLVPPLAISISTVLFDHSAVLSDNIPESSTFKV